jgi:hypothetical protein
MLNWTVVTNSLVSFTAISFGAWAGILCSMLCNHFARRAVATPSAGRGPCGPRETTGR